MCGVQKDIKKIKINYCLLTVLWLILFEYEMINTKEETYYMYVLYVNNYIYNIYSFLLIIVYIVCIIICFLI